MTEWRSFGCTNMIVRDGVATVRLADQRSLNAATQDLGDGLQAALAAAVADPTARVVLVESALPTVFCLGAGQEMLADKEDISSVTRQEPFVRAFAHCPLPVVAAMQGHAVGGGLLLGLYADIPVLSERSVYAGNFLQYGLAPYFGATYILPARLGDTLGVEMLLTARGFRGHELRERNAPVLVVPHDDVLSVSAEMAEQVARAPRRSVELVKEELSARIFSLADPALDWELAPHSTSCRLPVVGQLAGAAYGPPHHGFIDGARRENGAIPGPRQWLPVSSDEPTNPADQQTDRDFDLRAMAITAEVP